LIEVSLVVILGSLALDDFFMLKIAVIIRVRLRLNFPHYIVLVGIIWLIIVNVSHHLCYFLTFLRRQL
jgi:hypothetical protein